MTDQMQSIFDAPVVVPPNEADFDGETYEPERDLDRLQSQLGTVWRLLQDGHWWTLAEIAENVPCSQASASARLRDLRKEKFGAYKIERKRENNVFSYRLVGGKGDGIPQNARCRHCDDAVEVINRLIENARRNRADNLFRVGLIQGLQDAKAQIEKEHA